MEVKNSKNTKVKIFRKFEKIIYQFSIKPYQTYLNIRTILIFIFVFIIYYALFPKILSLKY